jgi:lysophospholipase
VETRYPTARHALHLETDSARDPWLKAIDQTLRSRTASPPANP